MTAVGVENLHRNQTQLSIFGTVLPTRLGGDVLYNDDVLLQLNFQCRRESMLCVPAPVASFNVTIRTIFLFRSTLIR